MDSQNPGCADYINLTITLPWYSVLTLKSRRKPKIMRIAVIFSDARFPSPDTERSRKNQSATKYILISKHWAKPRSPLLSSCELMTNKEFYADLNMILAELNEQWQVGGICPWLCISIQQSRFINSFWLPLLSFWGLIWVTFCIIPPSLYYIHGNLGVWVGIQIQTFIWNSTSDQILKVSYFK